MTSRTRRRIVGFIVWLELVVAAGCGALIG